MKQATPSVSFDARCVLAAFVALFVAMPLSAARAQAGFSGLKGMVIDSIHNAPLAHATVMIDGTSRSAVTDQDGRYLIDSIPAGKHRVVVMHPLLDTLGISMRTPDYMFAAGTTHELDVPVPGPEYVAARLCTRVQRERGPAVLIGFVRDPDTSAPAIGANVELVYYEADPIGRKQLRKRNATVDSTGSYRMCMLPADMSGKVQVFRHGVSSGEVPVEVTNGALALRSFSVAANQTVVEVKGDSGKMKRVAKGTARVTGKVMDKKGQPLAGARVMLQGGGTAAVTKSNGEFTLDSLPSGTQAIEVRKIGYSVTEVPVELASNSPAKATVTMSDAVPMLETMRVEAASDKALSDLGYTSRKQMGFGYFLDGNKINHASQTFSDVLRVAPGLKVVPVGDGRSYQVVDSRSASNGCVNFYVDNTYWEQMSPGDIDSYVRPDELVAVEIYHGSETPPQFQKAGQSGCAAVVAWTQAKVSTMGKRKK
jgi:hypothetical protein